MRSHRAGRVYTWPSHSQMPSAGHRLNGTAALCRKRRLCDRIFGETLSYRLFDLCQGSRQTDEHAASHVGMKLANAVRGYAVATNRGKLRILEGFTQRRGMTKSPQSVSWTTTRNRCAGRTPDNARRGEAARVLIVLWEASDRVCDKRSRQCCPLYCRLLIPGHPQKFRRLFPSIALSLEPTPGDPRRVIVNASPDGREGGFGA